MKPVRPKKANRPRTHDKANTTTNEAQAANEGDDIDEAVDEPDQGAGLVIKAKHAQDGGEDQDDGSAHEHVEAKVEGIGAVPQGTIVLEGGFEEENFHQKSAEIAQMVGLVLMLPPVGILHVAATVFGLGTFMRNGVEFPASMHRRFFHIVSDFEKRCDCTADECEVPQQVKECNHASTPVWA